MRTTPGWPQRSWWRGFRWEQHSNTHDLTYGSLICHSGCGAVVDHWPLGEMATHANITFWWECGGLLGPALLHQVRTETEGCKFAPTGQWIASRSFGVAMRASQVWQSCLFAGGFGGWGGPHPRHRHDRKPQSRCI